MELYDRIKSLCERQGITVGRMCDSIGLSKGAMTDLKMGRKKNIRTDTAAKIASFLGVSMDTLLGGREGDAVILGYHSPGQLHLRTSEGEPPPAGAQEEAASPLCPQRSGPLPSPPSMTGREQNRPPLCAPAGAPSLRAPTEEETLLLERFRALPEIQRRQLLEMAKILSDHC